MAGERPVALPDRLRTQVLADWAPVAPLRAPWRRAMIIAPIAALMAGIAATYWGPQPDWDAPGFGITVTLSALQWGAGLGLLALALSEAIPGRATARAALLMAAGAVIAILALNLVAKDAVAAADVPPGREWRFWAICLRGPLALAVPVLLLGGAFVVRAFPVRPARAGLFAGLAAGVVIDAGWRIGCFVTEASHVIGAHWLAVGASGALGAVLVPLADRLRWRR